MIWFSSKTNDRLSLFKPGLYSRELRFCPLTEFVYQAAVTSGGTSASTGSSSSQVFDGILKSLVRQLAPEPRTRPPELVSFREPAPAGARVRSQALRPRKRMRRKRKPSVQEEDTFIPEDYLETDFGYEEKRSVISKKHSPFFGNSNNSTQH